MKIDKSFFLELTTSARSRAIVRAIVRMAELLDLLREMGAGQAQGFHFARTMALKALWASSLLGRQDC